MSPRPFLFAVAAAAAAVGSNAATVTPAMASESGITVPHQDLNLATEAGLAALDRRIARAAGQVCGTAYIMELKFAADVAACRADVIASAQEQRDALVGGQRYAAVRVVRAAN